MTATIKLKRAPSRRDHDRISLAAQKPCSCTERTDKAREQGVDVLCTGCAARRLLNEIVSLAETLT